MMKSIQSKTHKSHKKLWISLSVVAILLLIPVFTAGWYGFVPGLSSVFGSNKPRDLGVRYSQADITSYKKKSTIGIRDYAYAPVNPKYPAEKSILALPKSANNLSLTQEEITAAVNSTGISWLPTENVQVRLSDGVIEMSGTINVSKLDEFELHISTGDSSDIQNAIHWAQRLANNPPFYAKGHATINNNVLSFKLDKAEIGRFEIPLGSIGQDLKNTTQTTINSDEFSVKSARLTSGNLIFTGTYPTRIYVER